MKQAVITIEEPNGHLRYASLPIYVYDGTKKPDTEKLEKDVYTLAKEKLGMVLLLILNGWERKSYE